MANKKQPVYVTVQNRILRALEALPNDEARVLVLQFVANQITAAAKWDLPVKAAQSVIGQNGKEDALVIR